MISTTSTTSDSQAKHSRLNIFLIAGTLITVLVVIFLINSSFSDTPVFQEEPLTQVNQAIPPVESSTLPLDEPPPVLWLQASGTSSGNAAWAPSVLAPFDTLWTLSTGRELFAPPAIVGEMIFIAGNDRVLRGIERNTGEQIWSRAVTCGISGGVAADSTTVYFSGQDGYMYALDLETGSENWKTGLGYHIFTDACIFQDSLILAGNSMGSIAALNRSTGELVWDDTMDGLLLGPALSDSIAVFTSEAGAAGAWDIAGNSIWYRGFTSQPSAPSIVGEKLYIGFSSGKVLALSLYSGETLWETELDNVSGRTVLSRPAIVNDSLLLAGTCDNRVFCLETEGGSLIWETELENWVSLSPAVCDSIVYVSCDDNRIHLLNLSTGLPIETIETGAYSGTPPVIYKGILYTGNSDGDFLAITGSIPEHNMEEE